MKQAITLFLSLFTALSFAQAEKKEEKIKKISEDACACIAKIDLDKSKKEKSEDIKTCIQSVSMAYQIENSLLGSLEKAMETVKSDGVSKTDSTAVTTDKNIVINVYASSNCSIYARRSVRIRKFIKKEMQIFYEYLHFGLGNISFLFF